MAIPEVTAFQGRTGCRLDFALRQGGRVCLDVVRPDIVRVLFLPDGAPRVARTWSLAPNGGDIPWEGLPRADAFELAEPAFTTADAEDRLCIQTDSLRLDVHFSPFRIVWTGPAAGVDAPRTFAADRPTEPYRLDPDGAVFHALARAPGDRIYGLGEKAGALNRAGRRYRMLGLDAFNYDAATTDPLYKHIPFTITKEARSGLAYGLFYDNLSTAVFDLGCEIDSRHGPYRYYQAEGGDLDYYLIFGPQVRDVVGKFAALTGAMAFGPKWSLGFCGAAATLSENDGAEDAILDFAEACGARGIPCESFNLGSGYSAAADRRHVFGWNRGRFPDPRRLGDALRQRGLRLAAGVQPYLLTDHPNYADAAARGLFVRSNDGDAPVNVPFPAGAGGHLDFTNPATIAWWKEQIATALLDNGVAALCNDMNEFEVWDRDASCAGFGTPVPAAPIRPVQGMLMSRASRDAQVEHAPDARPHVASRSACPGLQRYARTWTGDNGTSWRTLKYSVRMGLGLSLSGQFNLGHEIGGVAGPPPDPELLVRWVQNGIFQPRFAINSRNDDGSDTLPWMHEEVAGIVRDAIQFRYHLMPYLYTLYHRAHRDCEPIVRPTFYDFETDPRTFDECDDFMLGDQMLIASVVEPGVAERTVYLPKGPDGWVDIHRGTWHGSGKSVVLPAPLDVVPVLARDGAILPMNANPRPVAPVEDTDRMLWVFPHRREGKSQFRLYEDDGETTAYERGHFCEIDIVMETTPDAVHLFAHREGVFEPGYSEFKVVLPTYERRPIRLNGWPVDRVTEPLVLTI